MIKNTISDLYDEFEFVKENLSARKKEKYDSILLTEQLKQHGNYPCWI